MVVVVNSGDNDVGEEMCFHESRLSRQHLGLDRNLFYLIAMIVTRTSKSGWM